MVSKFTNPHSLSQDVQVTTRSEIAERAGSPPLVQDESSLSLKRDLDSMLQHTWAVALAVQPGVSSAKKARSIRDERDDRLTFRLLSSMRGPRRISLCSKPARQPASRPPDGEDDETQAETRRIRSLSVAVKPDCLERNAVSIKRIDSKAVTVRTKTPLASASLTEPLPPLLVIEEARASKTVQRGPPTIESFAASPHEPRSSCIVLPVTSVSDQRETPNKARRRPAKERLSPAYWRPSPEQRGKCMGYALGYPSSWAPDQRYVRDAMKRGIPDMSCYARRAE